MKFLFTFLTFLAIDCSNNNAGVNNQESEKKALEKLALEIKAIADKSVCSDVYACNFVGFGSKPCGGNWEFLVYSSSIDTTNFLNKVKKYNDLEKKYNTKWNIVSDCMLVMPPDHVICNKGKCSAVYK